MAQHVTKWIGARGGLYDTEEEADLSLADDKILTDLTECIYRNVDYIRERVEAEVIAIVVMRDFNVTRRPA